MPGLKAGDIGRDQAGRRIIQNILPHQRRGPILRRLNERRYCAVNTCAETAPYRPARKLRSAAAHFSISPARRLRVLEQQQSVSGTAGCKLDWLNKKGLAALQVLQHDEWSGWKRSADIEELDLTPVALNRPANTQIQVLESCACAACAIGSSSNSVCSVRFWSDERRTTSARIVTTIAPRCNALVRPPGRTPRPRRGPPCGRRGAPRQTRVRPP